MAGLDRINRRIVATRIRHTGLTAHTLDGDASQIVAEKQAAQFTYKGEQGYMPMIGHLAEAAVVVFDEFREGNIAPATGKLEFIQACEARLPKGHRIAHVRLDSAGYQAGIFNYCEDTGKSFAIGGRLDTPSLKVIGGNASRRTVPHHPRPQLRAGASDVPVAASRSSPPTTRRASMHAARLAQNLPIYPLRIAAAALARSRLLKIRFGIQFLVPRDPPPT